MGDAFDQRAVRRFRMLTEPLRNASDDTTPPEVPTLKRRSVLPEAEPVYFSVPPFNIRLVATFVEEPSVLLPLPLAICPPPVSAPPPSNL